MATLQFSEGSDIPVPLHQSKQLLNNIIDGMANVRPSSLWMEVPLSPTSYEAGYRKINYGMLASAINGVAWWLEKELGRGENFETLTYVGPNDFRSIPMLLGAVKAGYKLLLVSPRNTIAGYINLFDKLECKVLLRPRAPHMPIVAALRGAYRLQELEIPSVEELLNKPHPHYPFHKTFAEARNEPLVVLHTSGTTSLPKPITLTHDYAASFIQSTQARTPLGFRSPQNEMKGSRLFLTLPPFHAGGIFVSLFEAVANQTVVIMPLADVALTAQVIVEGVKYAKADFLFLAPPFVEQISKDPCMLNFVSTNVAAVAYAGGDVLQAYGDAIASRTKFYNYFGATESGILPTIQAINGFAIEDWKYLQPHPAAGFEFRLKQNGLYEAFIVRNQNLEDEQPVFKLFPHLQEYPTHDMFSQHPTNPDLWKHRGRSDDIITFITGQQTNPIGMEQLVSRHPEVRAALMAGTGRYQPSLLIELIDDRSLAAADKSAVVERLWPTIEAANQSYQTDTHISKAHIFFTNSQKPLPRSAKGTLQRRLTWDLYKIELDELYAEAGDMRGPIGPPKQGGVIY